MVRKRPGFTLMEIAIVMAIIVILMVLTVPSIGLIYGDQGSVDASDSIRAKWAKARSQAIHDGVPYSFGVAWGQSSWRVAPDGSEFWGNSAGTTPGGTYIEIVGNLPHDIRFIQADAPPLDPKREPSPDAGTVEPGQFVQLVTFYPDGTVQCFMPDGSSADILLIALEGRSGRRLILSLRAMTGVANTEWE
jgi:prepilin-type N-terminal cleavage/methylation domain-containing protein